MPLFKSGYLQSFSVLALSVKCALEIGGVEILYWYLILLEVLKS